MVCLRVSSSHRDPEMYSGSSLFRELGGIKKYINIQYVLSTYLVPGRVLRSPLIPFTHTNPMKEINYFLHFTEEETGIYSVPKVLMMDLGFKPKSLISYHILYHKVCNINMTYNW